MMGAKLDCFHILKKEKISTEIISLYKMKQTGTLLKPALSNPEKKNKDEFTKAVVPKDCKSWEKIQLIFLFILFQFMWKMLLQDGTPRCPWSWK